MTLCEMIGLASQNNVSDIHINTKAIFFRINKKIVRFAPQDSINIDIESVYAELKSLDSINNQSSVSLVIGGVKCRISSFLSSGNLCFALRILRSKIPTLESLNTPKILESLSLKDSGLILVCGATGVGKSTTIAAMLNHINHTCYKHILTIEDPVEYEHTGVLSLVSQREIGLDSQDFESALKSSLRQDPDVILIGEILESNTLRLAINHALSGHLVISSFHAHSCTHAIGRILGMCGSDSKESANANLADCLQGIITQKLYAQNDNLKNSDLKVDFEILIATPAVRILIKENKLNQLDSQISMGKEFGMQHFRF